MSEGRPYPPDWLSASDAAYLLSIGESTFRDYVRQGILPAGIMIIGSRRWSRKSLNAALDLLQEQVSDADPFFAGLRGENHGAKEKGKRDVA